jgi:hypothetical protein
VSPVNLSIADMIIVCKVHVSTYGGSLPRRNGCAPSTTALLTRVAMPTRKRFIWEAVVLPYMGCLSYARLTSEWAPLNALFLK